MWHKRVVKHSAFIKARCEPELVERVDALAAHWKMRPSDIVRIALESYLGERAGTANPMIAPPLREPAPAPPISYAAGPGPDQIVAEAAARTISAARAAVQRRSPAA
jgi:hypothetical protein